MNKLFLSSQVQEYEKSYFGKGNLDKNLMLKAAEVTAEYITKNYKHKKYICICGPGNNGGDGYYVGICLFNAGFDVKIVDALENKTKSHLCVEASNAARDKGLIYKPSILNKVDSDVLIIDAIFGTSLKGSFDKHIINLIQTMNSYEHIFSIDVPSGIHPDTGVACKAYVDANKTISFVGRKLGLSLNEGKIAAGEKYFHNLNLQMEKESQAVATSYTFDDVKNLLPKRLSNSHKGNHGSALVMGGDMDMGGAAILAAEAALKSGTGLVSLLTQPIHLEASLSRNPEIMAIGYNQPKEIGLALNNKNVFICGPGLSASTWSEQVMEILIEHIEINSGSVVFDAGALRYIAKNDLCLKNVKNSLVLTPHPGEAAALLGLSSKDIQADRINAAKNLVAKYNATIVLKGAGTIIATDDDLFVCEEGGPELATGGTGDILAGLIGSFIGQGLSAHNASLLAVATHGIAGSEFVKLNGEKGLAASELIPLIRKKLNNK